METRKLSELKTNPLNPRGEVGVDDSLRELAASINAQGLLQPIVITPDGTIVAGHRRAKACQLLELHSIEVIVKELTEIEQLAVMLVENIQRRSLDVVQEGKAYLALKTRGLSYAQICKAVGCSLQTLKGRVTVASLTPEVHYAFASGQIGMIAADRLLPLPRDKQIYWVERAIREGMAGNQLACAITESKASPRIITAPTKHEQNIVKLTSCQERLERIDKDLDEFNDLRSAQVIIRQAVSKIVESMMARAKQNRAA